MIWFSSNCGSVCGWFCSLIGFSEKINQAQSVSDDLTESQNLRVFYAMSVFFFQERAMPSENLADGIRVLETMPKAPSGSAGTKRQTRPGRAGRQWQGRSYRR
ncbi:hypothetical protein CKX34_07065 [Neisseria gonorrhoeae]|nr:hypothetical protein CKX34_07065 [Neisseria gonorrhoeae]